ncbi:helix-turn-helix domain-containing protein [Phytohabitans rumicis]|uniref:Transcriptional regulator n=1 Tax=Phytohabitans rumicis TaxID=1076125 RepID=A0A6V8LEK3_9ACTN|nr:helix-turn-helix transcriptional regulator [Phytohabitans rumicis]GFJ93241.1 transcriptional regulator [Phytohabitans rumicis]
MSTTESTQAREARRHLGAQLAALRDAAGLRQHELAPKVGYGRSTIGNVEIGSQRVPRQFWLDCDDVLGTGGILTEHYDAIEATERQAAKDVALRLGEPDGASSVDPAMAVHWTGMLHLLAGSHNMFGPRQVNDAACRELAVIGRYRHEAIGDIKTGLLAVEARWAEFASWTADNVGDTAASTYWLDRALVLARKAGDAPMASYVFMRQAQQAADRLDGARAATLATTAATAPLTDRDRALCVVRQAQGHALRGDRDACSSALKTAHRLALRAERVPIDDDPGTIGRHCTHAYVQAHEGYCLLRLGNGEEAARLLDAVLDQWPAGFRQDEALIRTWLAMAYAMANRVAEAGGQASQALGIAAATSSARAMRVLGELDARLAPHSGAAEVDAFRSAFALVRSTRRM